MNEKKAAPTPDQMRALADGPIATTERPSDAMPTMHNVREALRAAADQLEAVTPPFSAPQYAKLLREQEHLRTVIENAPHEEHCMIYALIKYDRRCTCWKVDAL